MEMGDESCLSGCNDGGGGGGGGGALLLLLLLLLSERVCEAGPSCCRDGGVLDRRDHPRGVSGVMGEYEGEYGMPIARWGDLVGVKGLEKEGVTGPRETLFPLT